MKAIKNKEKANDCLICSSVIKETKKVFRLRLSECIVELIPVIVEMQTVNNPGERTKILSAEIIKLIRQKPAHENFYRFLQTKIEQYLEKVGVQTLPHYLADLTNQIIRTIDAVLRDNLTFESIYIHFDDEKELHRFARIKTVCSPIRFKDNLDFDIFCEILLNLSEQRAISFYTDDEEFVKKGNKAYTLLQKELSFKGTRLRLNLVGNT